MAVLTNPAPNSDAQAPGSEIAGQDKAEHELEFRARHSLTIDPMAHTLLSLADARRLGAVPLGKEGGRTVIAVADPAESRLEALRQLAGPTTKFVLIAADAMNALLKSRIFVEDAAAEENGTEAPSQGPAMPAPKPVLPPQDLPPTPPFPPPPEPPPAAFAPLDVVPVGEPQLEPPIAESDPAELQPVDAQPAEVEPLAVQPADVPVGVKPHDAQFAEGQLEETELVGAQPVEDQPGEDGTSSALPTVVSEPQSRIGVEGELADLSAAVAGAAKLLLVLQERVTDFANRFDDASHALEAARQEARDHKERLAVISAKNDQDRARLRTFALGLAQAFEGLEETKSQLLELIDED
jgi:hypothetical protein